MTKSQLEPWQSEDAARLKNLFKLHSKWTQDEFADRFNLGSTGMVWQLLNGYRPLNIEHAVAFAVGLGVAIDEFSPQLALKIQNAYKNTEIGKTIPTGDWPFGVPRTKFEHLSPEDKKRLDALVRAFIENQ